MGKREMSYEDYGITKNEKNFVFEFCQKSNDEEKEFIKVALSKLNPYISPFIFESIVKNLSYEDIDKKSYLYILKNDFYAERRYGVYCIKDWMMLNRIWEKKYSDYLKINGLI